MRILGVVVVVLLFGSGTTPPGTYDDLSFHRCIPKTGVCSAESGAPCSTSSQGASCTWCSEAPEVTRCCFNVFNSCDRNGPLLANIGCGDKLGGICISGVCNGGSTPIGTCSNVDNECHSYGASSERGYCGSPPAPPK